MNARTFMTDSFFVIFNPKCGFAISDFRIVGKSVISNFRAYRSMNLTLLTINQDKMDFKRLATYKFHRLISCVVLFAVTQLLSNNSFAQYTKLLDFGTTLGHRPCAPITDGTFLYGMTFGGGVNHLGTIYKIKPDGTGFTKLLDFDGANGSNPYGSLFYDGSTFLYGMAASGGANDNGTIFKLKTDGTGFAKLFDFSFATSGATPYGSLISDGTSLYGMTTGGGAKGSGTVFKINTDGTGFTDLFDFDYFVSGGHPYGTLYFDNTYLYGMTNNGSANPYGSIFRIKPDGTGFSNLKNFDLTHGGGPFGNSLIGDGTYLYGMTSQGGQFSSGTIFRIAPDGTAFSTLLDLDNTTGGTPYGSLISDGTLLYGTTSSGGANSVGTAFKIMPDGTEFVKILDFDVSEYGGIPEGSLSMIGTTLYGTRSGDDGTGIGYVGTLFSINANGSGYNKFHYFQRNGSTPNGSLFSDGTFLYGMTSIGGLSNFGNIFKVKPDGSGYTSLFDFDGVNSGRNPNGSLIYDGTFFYGMTNSGGLNDFGIIFKVKPDGSSFTNLYDFDQVNGSYPYGSLLSDGTFLYAMSNQGGQYGFGTIIKIKPDGTGLTKILDFDNTSNGAYPQGSLISDGTFLYGTSSYGSTSNGTIFKIKPDGTGYLKVIDFDGPNFGDTPSSELYYDGTFLYAMAISGGANGNGTIIKVKTDGTSPSKLFDFESTTSGSEPRGALIPNSGYLYGVTEYNGAPSGYGYTGSWGTLFRIKPDGTGFQKFMNFVDGQNPMSSLLINGSFLYGMTNSGGVNSAGIMFKTTLTPFVSISGFSPDNGVVGSYVTITGTDFDLTPANNVVKFNGVTATVKRSTIDSLIVVVPSGATTGLISVTANGTTATSTTDFTVTTQTAMTDGTIQACNVSFDAPNDTNDHIETFVPVNSGDKIKVSFSSFSAGDILNVYDGPTTSSPQVASLTGNSLPSDITATGSGGELTFEFLWQDNFSTDWQALITCVSANPPTISSTKVVTQIGASASVNLISLISTPNNDLDTSSLEVIVPPVHGTASINSLGVLTVDYADVAYAGKDSLTIKACDKAGACATQQIFIEVVGDIVVYNGISPSGKNPSLVVEYIDVLPDTKTNSVYIFDRWENQVWHGENYNNSSVKFTGESDGGSALPSGVYFYRIEFASGKKTKTGFISLRRQ